MKKLLQLLTLFISATTFAQTGNIIVPSGHATTIEITLMDKQGKYLYTLETNKVIMWDVKTHDQLYTFPKGGKQMALSNDGKKLMIEGDCYSTVTGKPLFKAKGSSFAFSADDTKIYVIDFNKLVVTDAATGKGEFMLDAPGFGYNIYSAMLDDTHLLAYSDDVWRVYNLAERKMEQEFKQEYGNTMVYFPNLHCMANYSNKAQTLFFKDIYTGKVVKTLPKSDDKPVLIPSADDKQFIYFNSGMPAEAYTVYNGATWLPANKIPKLDRVLCGVFKGSAGTLWAGYGPDINVINTKSGAVLSTFKRQSADFGGEIHSSMEYNYSTTTLNFNTDDSVYRSINMLKLKPFRYKQVRNLSTMAFSPSGDTVAIFNENRTLTIKNINTGKLLFPPKKLPDEPALAERDNFFFTNTATELYYTTFSIPKQKNTLYRMNLKTGLVTPSISFNTSHFPLLHADKDLFAAIDGGYQYTHAKVWNITTGKLLFDKDLGENHYGFITVMPDKKRVLMAGNGKGEIYDIATGKLVGNLGVALGDGLTAFTPDFSIVATSGGGGGLTVQKADGTQLYYHENAHLENIRRIIFSEDGALMYTVSEDQTIKAWWTQTGKLLGTLYLFNDSNDYVFIDEFGRFDGTEGGIKRMYYFRNRVKVSLDVVYEKFYTPNLYQRLVNGEVFEPIDIIINPQPKARISYAEVTRNLNVVEDKVQAYNNTTGVAEITVNASAENDKVDEIRLFHNGKIVNLATRGLFVTDNTTGTDTKKYTLNLLTGVNNIRAIALNSQRTESEPDEIVVTYKAAGQPNAPTPVNNNKAVIAMVDKDATMHLVVVGINAYKNPKMSLNYALADATAFKDEAEKDSKTIISNLKTYFVTDDKADKKGIVAAFAEVQKNAKPQDVFVFYYAGHGVISNKNKEFYLVPNDVIDLKNVDEALAQNGIPSKMLQQYAIDIAAQKQVFILDACQSAGAFAQLMSNDANQQKSMAVVARSTGTHWIAASGSQQFAQEFAQLGHGAFTYVLLKAMKGEAAANKMVTINGLKNFLQVQVPDLMKKYNGAPQYPATYGYGSDFPVEVMQ